MKRTLIHLAVLAVCGRLNAQPVVLFGRVNHTDCMDDRFAYAA